MNLTLSAYTTRNAMRDRFETIDADVITLAADVEFLSRAATDELLAQVDAADCRLDLTDADETVRKMVEIVRDSRNDREVDIQW